ncbi:unnamed protein product [Prorocentrum cordatum]|uniref:Calcium-dependent kinase n=1 Tax=Prorocentrum cordatum TaxID=2364126 RepID=A0ABN9QN00_9DINO|nr:unnamed protein product [Polarella glacialis]
MELHCQGAKLTRIFLALSRSQSPFAEVELDGRLLARTRPHEDGNLEPWWDAKVPISQEGRTLVFRVLVKGLIGDERLCGAGAVDVQKALQHPRDQYTVKLMKKGETTGVLSFALRARRAPAAAPGALAGAAARPGQPGGYPQQQHLQQQAQQQQLQPLPQQPLPQQPLPQPQPLPKQQQPLPPPPRGPAEAPSPAARGAGAGGAGIGAGSAGASRLSMGTRGQTKAAALMRSKDLMREYADRPFRRPGLPGVAERPLGLQEFSDAMGTLCADLEMPNPGPQGIARMFEKHGGRTEGGVSREEFEALLFRMLCFMLAKGDVNVQAVPATPTAGGAARDAGWREEFLKKNNKQIREVYEFGKKLGQGSFGSVYVVYHRTELSGANRRERVCKVVSKASAEKQGTPHEMVRQEFAVLKRLDHPHVLRIFEDAVKNPYTRDPREWERWVCRAMQHTLEAVAYCHARGVIHKDLKPENVMMSSPRGAPTSQLHVVVVDFGLAQMFSQSDARSQQVAGTPPFMAPEVWQGNFGRGCDVWACGVMLFFMLSGRYPFMASRLQDFPAAVAREPDWGLVSGASSGAQWTCSAMLCKDERLRPSASDLLRGPWLAAASAQAGQAPVLESVRLGILQVGERSEFEKFVGRLVATQLDAGQLRRVNDAFRALDADRNGTLGRDELVRGLVLLGAGQAEASQAVDHLDVGRTGQVSYTEFLAGALNLRRKSPQQRDELLWLAWQQFGPDAAGRVSTSAIQSALAARGMTVAEMPSAFLQQLRRGSAGSMSFAEFKDLFDQDQTCVLMSSLRLDPRS